MPGSTTNPRATVLLSGGIDSAACAHFLLRHGHHVDAVFLDYGQAAIEAEKQASAAVANRLGIVLTRFVISGYSSFADGELVGRNAFLATSALFLTKAQSSILAMGIHAGVPYYDCSARFIDLMSTLVRESTNGRTTFIAPFSAWAKADVINYFFASDLRIEETYSCEAGTQPPCGRCASCLDRKQFAC